MDTITLHNKMRQQGIDLGGDHSLEERHLAFSRAPLRLIIPPKDVSDRTSFRRIADWLASGCVSGKFNEYVIFRRVLDFALEVSGPSSRNSAVVFTAILKKELGCKGCKKK